MNTAKQIKDLIRNLSRKSGADPQILIRQYMMEHLLERISLTKFRDFFILKGGMLVSSHVGVSLRSTLDMDATIKGYPLDGDALKTMIDEILSIELDDGIHYRINSIDNIHEESDYNGYRLKLTAFLDESQIPLKIDITTGDRITPKEIEFNYPMLLEKRSINIYSYNLETILAEKLETILSRSIANTRMRDYYDIYILTKIKWYSIDHDVFREAFVETCRYRGNQNIMDEADQTLARIISDSNLEQSWQIYQQRYEYAQELSFDTVCASIEKLVTLYKSGSL